VPTATARTWTLRRPDRAQVDRLVSTLQVPPLVATLLVNRGHAGGEGTARHLSPDLHHLHDPGLLPGMAAATARLGRAIEAGEPILVHGDYDVDGITGTTLLVRLLRHLGADVHWHVPDRFTDGYSFGEHSLVKAREVGAKVVVSVDNGTSAVETITQLLEAGVETIVTDHHEPPRGPLPPATAIVNPKLADSTYPFRELCGGAVAFKLAWGLAQERSGAAAGGRVSNDLRDLLVDLMGLVALATVCDVVPLLDENRVLGRFGLKALGSTTSPGLRALLEVAGLGDRQLVAEDVGFQLGPRLNAAGRMANAGRAIEVLLAEDLPTARQRARALDELNLERKRVERELLETALAEARRFEDPERYPVIVVAGQGWHQGVIGIIAARLVDRMNRPALVIGLDGEVGRASARSVQGVSILELMHAGAAHMIQYGGHAMAAGCEVRADQVDALREAICDSARQRRRLRARPGPRARRRAAPVRGHPRADAADRPARALRRAQRQARPLLPRRAPGRAAEGHRRGRHPPAAAPAPRRARAQGARLRHGTPPGRARPRRADPRGLHPALEHVPGRDQPGAPAGRLPGRAAALALTRGRP